MQQAWKLGNLFRVQNKWSEKKGVYAGDFESQYQSVGRIPQACSQNQQIEISGDDLHG